MDNAKIKTYFGAHHIDDVKALIDDNGQLPAHTRLRNPKVTLILAICLGFIGMDRLYQSGVKVWLCKLGMLMFSLGTWWLVDIGYAVKMTQDVNYKHLSEAAAA